jgi:hypothetical protein
MIRMTNARTRRTAVLAATVLCLVPRWAWGGQHNNNGQRQAQPHYSQPQHNNAQQYRAPQYRPAPQNQPRQQQYQPPAQNRYQQAYPGRNAVQPTYPNSNYTRPGYNGSQTTMGAQRAPYAGQGAGSNGPHLQDWLSRHQSTPLQDQERVLRSDPSFSHQAPAQQQREMQQLHQLNQMSVPERDRRVARNEMLERLSPEERMSINRSGRAWAALPPDRQAMMKRAFQDLRSVPLDQRQTVLNSARYQGQFSPQERDMLSNFLKVEPYEPPR